MCSEPNRRFLSQSSCPATFLPRCKILCPPGIEGPLRKFQVEGHVQIDMYYVLDFGNQAKGVITIWESNFSRDPILNLGLDRIDIRGKSVLATGSGSDHATYYFDTYFDEVKLWFVVEFERIPTAEAQKVVESMLQ